MLSHDLISDVIPALKTSDTGIQALNWMEVFRVKHLPIVNNEEFLGLISDQDIYDLNDPQAAIGNHELSISKAYVNEYQHIYEVIELLSRLKLTLVPVLDDEKTFLGVITMEDLTREFANLSAMQHPGGIIVLEMNEHDYSLSEISNIVEGNNLKILSLYVSSDHKTRKMSVTLKINTSEIASVLQTFERYSYHVIATHTESKNMNEFYQDRFDEFINYLNI